ncbi:MAG: TVP38/TMEM64 family protein [Piscirickettsiaceae bacterium]|jgi:uncharacterized membrane protein YdjX (TVP38/TMEM64 family)|nr:TVP38/TMEM64 family protein [Piscirickettsiaceae bacterium]
MPMKWLLSVIFIGLIASFFLFGGPEYFTLAGFQDYKASMLDYVDQHFVASVFIAMAIYIAAVALSLPGAAFLSLLMGFVFGRWLGWALLVVAATIGAVLVFWLARYLFSDWAKTKLQGVAAAQKIIDTFERHALHYLLFLRLVPLFPFWLVNLTMAMTTIKTRQYAIGTFLGILPGSFVFANLGQSLATIERLDQVFSSELLLAFGLLGLLMLVPVFMSKTKQSFEDK